MDAKAKAQEMLNQIKAGRTVFTRATDGWMIVGPAADVQAGNSVAVTRADGTTTQVVVTKLGVSKTVQGVAYTVASFTEPVGAPKPAQVTPQLDRQATLIASIMGFPAPRATGHCHYCGLPLVKGECEECV